MYVKSENLKKLEQLAEQMHPTELVHTHVVEILIKIKTMLEEKKIDREGIIQQINFIIDTVQKNKK